MRSIPSYWLPRPALTFAAARRAEFEQLYATAIAPGTGGNIAYALGAPKWQFLAQIRGHDDQALAERSAADPGGFPGLDQAE